MEKKMNDKIDRNSTLTEDVQKLLDKDAIKELVYEWDYLTDERVGSDQVIDTFCTDDVIYDAGPLGRTEGKTAFKEAAREIFDNELLFTRHMRHNPIIKVNGDEAEGTWYADIPSITGDGKAVWIMGKYELAFRRINGNWKISAYTFQFSYMTDFSKGWVKEPFIEGVPGELNWKSAVAE
jgi:ketosteroid isomerase-like protein